MLFLQLMIINLNYRKVWLSEPGNKYKKFNFKPGFSPILGWYDFHFPIFRVIPGIKWFFYAMG